MGAVKRVVAGFGVTDICREMGISNATLYKWRFKYGGLDVSMVFLTKELEEKKCCSKRCDLKKGLRPGSFRRLKKEVVK
jgi:putative transposase